MPAPITWDDLKVFEEEISEDQATAMIATVWARARKIAPCLRNEAPDPNPLDDEDNLEDVKSILRDAVLRWYDKGSGAIAQRVAGDYQETMTSGSKGYFRPDEITALATLCIEHKRQAAHTLDTSGYGWEQPTTHPFLIAD